MKVQSVNEVIILSGLLLAQGNMFDVPLRQHQNRAQLFPVRRMARWLGQSLDHGKISCFGLVSVPDCQYADWALGWSMGRAGLRPRLNFRILWFTFFQVPPHSLILHIADVIAAAHLCINIFIKEPHKKQYEENKIYSIIIIKIFKHEVAKLRCFNVWFVASILTSTLVSTCSDTFLDFSMEMVVNKFL